jgi:hypothetical protein
MIGLLYIYETIYFIYYTNDASLLKGFLGIKLPFSS